MKLAPNARLLPALLFVLSPVLVFADLADGVLRRQALPWDHSLLLSLRSSDTPAYDVGMAIVSGLGGGRGLSLLSALILCALVMRRQFRHAAFFVLAVEGARITGRILKDVFDRSRPSVPSAAGEPVSAFPEVALIALVALMVALALLTRWRRPGVILGACLAFALGVETLPELWLPLEKGADSFPSGHAVGSMAFVAAVVLLLRNSRWRWSALLAGGLLVLGAGLSRVYFGVHYPSDVVAGWCLSLAWVAGLWLLFGNALQDHGFVIGSGPSRPPSDSARRPGPTV